MELDQIHLVGWSTSIKLNVHLPSSDDMKVKPVSFSFIFIAILTACSSFTKREPAASPIVGAITAEKIQRVDFELSAIYRQQWEVKQALERTPQKGAEYSLFDSENEGKKAQLEQRTQQLRDYRKNLELQLSAELTNKSWRGTGPWLELQNNPKTSTRTEQLIINELDAHLIGEKDMPAFALEQKVFGDYILEFKNRLTDSAASSLPLKARLECDGEILYKNAFGFSRKSATYDFDWYNNINNGQNIAVRFAPEVSECQLLFRQQEDARWTHKIRLSTLEKLLPVAASLTQHLEVCARPSGFSKQDPVSFFWQQDFNQVSCPQHFEKITPLRDPQLAFSTKIYNLIGTGIPKEAFLQKDPMVKLDFSRAPKLDLIWVSSLNFNADFYGDVLARALRYHADRGTQIRILIPEVTVLNKDKKIIDKLMYGRPNVKIQYYKFRANSGQDGSWLDSFHRVNHAKLLIGYSESTPEANFVVTGGRNVADPYLFKDKPGYNKYPWLIDYARNERPFIYYDDFEMELRGENVVKPILAQALQFWNRDDKTNFVRSTNINISRPMTTGQETYYYDLTKKYPMTRSLFSVPYADGGMLEKFYLQMLDSAEKEILLTTPYFRPSKVISEAFDRAALRGVKIKVLTRVQLAGDDVPALAEDVNKEGVNRHLKHLDIYEWIEPNSIMHAKLLVIDQKLSFVSSVNVNARSFIHDTESGVLILHEETSKQLRNEVLEYFKQSTQITEAKKIKWLNRKLIDLLDTYF